MVEVKEAPMAERQEKKTGQDVIEDDGSYSCVRLMEEGEIFLEKFISVSFLVWLSE